MPDAKDIQSWVDLVQDRYESYLKTSFYFKDPNLRETFAQSLRSMDLLKGPILEVDQGFKTGVNSYDLAEEYFPGNSRGLQPALLDAQLYTHQELAVRRTHLEHQNVVVATGTASGKTECFFYPILFELYRQYLIGELTTSGVRALILYPMNALANDQRERLGEICRQLQIANSSFAPSFGQYTGQTPEDHNDTRRNAQLRIADQLPGEMIFRTEMRNNPPHILLTNYSMLEYLLIRPKDSCLFDGDRGKDWKFIVLDEAHQYRGTRGMEMGMLIRRLKQRLRAGGRDSTFRVIATSATISSETDEKSKKSVAEFGQELFDESFTEDGVIFGDKMPTVSEPKPRRYHVFIRALEGAFLLHKEGEDIVILNRKEYVNNDGKIACPLEIALCQECGQHYYVGQVRESDKTLGEAVRDPSQYEFGVEYYLPVEENSTHILCRCCGKLSDGEVACGCNASVGVKKCASHTDRPDQLAKCEVCDYRRGGIGDPVQEIVHGSDGPNAVIATALHELLPEESRKILAFTDSRPEAAFFAWYVEDSYQKLRDRNLILRSLTSELGSELELSIEDLQHRAVNIWEKSGLFRENDTLETKKRRVLISIFSEALTEQRRISLEGVGLLRWSVPIPSNLAPRELMEPPWGLTPDEAQQLVSYLLDGLRQRHALSLGSAIEVPNWSNVVPPSRRPQSYRLGPPGAAKDHNVREWGSLQSAVVQHFLVRLLSETDLSTSEKRKAGSELMRLIWIAIRDHDKQRQEIDWILSRFKEDGRFQLNSRGLRISAANKNEIWECDTCVKMSYYNIRRICPRNKCPGNLIPANMTQLEKNHYRRLYKNPSLPVSLQAKEHTAQIDNNEARRRQQQFKNGELHLLSSSTTFEMGVDLGDLEAVFLRNVPPEPFNYTQRVGRSGRRGQPGIAITYCRRNPHDLYHYENPKERVMEGKISSPHLQITNEKVINRHVAAVTLAAFFKEPENKNRFSSVSSFLTSWENPCALSDLKNFCEKNIALKAALHSIVSPAMYTQTGLNDDTWIDMLAGPNGRLAIVLGGVCADFLNMRKVKEMLIQEQPTNWHKKVGKLERMMTTIDKEETLRFLSRKAVIPKYGFPVDVVELDIRSEHRQSRTVSLQRDLSQAIAEYAPGGKVIANKFEWESAGVKTIPAKELPVKYYKYDDARSFQHWNENDPAKPDQASKYLRPIFGFVTLLGFEPKEPSGRARRLYTTRPFFPGFEKEPLSSNFSGVEVTKAVPGKLVILCEGHNKQGFYICSSCGRHMTQAESNHKTPESTACHGILRNYSLGHELETDVMQLQFPQLDNEWDAYSLAYAVQLGAAKTLDIPNTDLNVTISGRKTICNTAIILYDNVPGGAGLVAQLEAKDIFKQVLRNAKNRVSGLCGCSSSCYGCLRSYRNQFAHPHLDRRQALNLLDGIAI